MYSSKNPKISQHTREQIWLQYSSKTKPCSPDSTSKVKVTQTTLAIQYSISRQTISKIIHRAKDCDFSIHKPVNNRYLTQEYIHKRQVKLEIKLVKKTLRKEKREEIAKLRYEHLNPGDLGHMDLKLLPPILGEKVIKGQKEYLLTLVDDCTRIAYFTIIQGKNQYQVKTGLERIFSRTTISFKAILSDNGKEFKGSQKQVNGYYKAKTRPEGQNHVVELLLQNMRIKHRYTKVRRPQTNGKVERLNRTISEEFLTQIHFENRLHRLAQLRLYEYHYNKSRTHQGIKNLTPYQKLTNLSPLKFM
jgi:transposase InsO family protein